MRNISQLASVDADLEQQNIIVLVSKSYRHKQISQLIDFFDWDPILQRKDVNM